MLKSPSKVLVYNHVFGLHISGNYLEILTIQTFTIFSSLCFHRQKSRNVICNAYNSAMSDCFYYSPTNIASQLGESRFDVSLDLLA